MRTIVGNRNRSAKRKNCQTGRNAACEPKMRLSILQRDRFSLYRYLALSFCLSMVFSANRYPLFRIVL